MYKLVQFILISIIASSFVSCSKKSPDNSSLGDNQGRGNQDESSDQFKPKECRQQKIVKILNSGNNIISRMRVENTLVNWNLESGEEFKTLKTLVMPNKISPDGKFMLRQVSFQKYQIFPFSIDEKTNISSFKINAASEPAPKVDFSVNNLITIVFRPYEQGLKKKVLIYSLTDKKFIYSFTSKNIYTKLIIIGYIVYM